MVRISKFNQAQDIFEFDENNDDEKDKNKIILLEIAV